MESSPVTYIPLDQSKGLPIVGFVVALSRNWGHLSECGTDMYTESDRKYGGSHDDRFAGTCRRCKSVEIEQIYSACDPWLYIRHCVTLCATYLQ